MNLKHVPRRLFDIWHNEWHRLERVSLALHFISIIVLMLTVISHFNNGTYSDFTIRCGTTTFKTLKMILCIQSEFFGNACYGHFKVSKCMVVLSGPVRPTEYLCFPAQEAANYLRATVCLADSEPLRRTSKSSPDIAECLFEPIQEYPHTSVLEDLLLAVWMGAPLQTHALARI